MNRRGFLQATLALAGAAALPLQFAKAKPAPLPPVTGVHVGGHAAYNRALTPEEMRTLVNGDGLLAVLDEAGQCHHSWPLPVSLFERDAAGAVRLCGELEFTCVSGSFKTHALECSCPSLFDGVQTRLLVLTMTTGDSMRVTLNWKVRD